MQPEANRITERTDLREHVHITYTVSDAYRADEIDALARSAHWKLDKQKDPLLFAFFLSLSLSLLCDLSHIMRRLSILHTSVSRANLARRTKGTSVTQSSAISITNAIFIVVDVDVAPPRNVHVSVRDPRPLIKF